MSVHTVWSRSTCSCWQQRWEMPSSGNREAKTNRVDRFEEEPQSVETQAAILDALEVFTPTPGVLTSCRVKCLLL